MASTPFFAKVLLIGGQVFLSWIYGTCGTILTLLQFIRLGRARFFRRVARNVPPSLALDPVYGKHSMLQLKSSDVKLHFVSKGSSDQPLMLFIHGFPECWYTWRYQMKHFSKNYHVVAIDQRGYGLSSKPPNVSDYQITMLTRDIADVIEQLGYKSCVLVGHDWGAVVAWSFAIFYPHLVDKLIIMNVPHPAAFRNGLSFRQIRRSWYIFFYQIPYIPELFFQSDDFAILNSIFYQKPMGLINKKQMTLEDLEVFKYTVSQPGAATATINYYRTVFRYQNDDVLKRVDVPVLIIWGCQDGALGEELGEASIKYCSNVRLKKIPHASHWVQQDTPDEVNKYMEEFLNEKITKNITD